MPRTARLYHPGGLLHLVSRFARDEWWLDRDGSRAAYLYHLGRAAERFDAEVLAYCLMSNHVHLVVVQRSEPLERFTKSVHTGFARWVSGNGRSGRAAHGPVFADRPRHLLVDRDAYLLSPEKKVSRRCTGGVPRAAASRRRETYFSGLVSQDRPLGA